MHATQERSSPIGRPVRSAHWNAASGVLDHDTLLLLRWRLVEEPTDLLWSDGQDLTGRSLLAACNVAILSAPGCSRPADSQAGRDFGGLQ